VTCGQASSSALRTYFLPKHGLKVNLLPQRLI